MALPCLPPRHVWYASSFLDLLPLSPSRNHSLIFLIFILPPTYLRLGSASVEASMLHLVAGSMWGINDKVEAVVMQLESELTNLSMRSRQGSFVAIGLSNYTSFIMAWAQWWCICRSVHHGGGTASFLMAWAPYAWRRRKSSAVADLAQGVLTGKLRNRLGSSGFLLLFLLINRCGCGCHKKPASIGYHVHLSSWYFWRRAGPPMLLINTGEEFYI